MGRGGLDHLSRTAILAEQAVSVQVRGELWAATGEGTRFAGAKLRDTGAVPVPAGAEIVELEGQRCMVLATTQAGETFFRFDAGEADIATIRELFLLP